jgi:hypothetical protein
MTSMSDYGGRVRVRVEEMAQNARAAPASDDDAARDPCAYARGLEVRHVLLDYREEP